MLLDASDLVGGYASAGPIVKGVTLRADVGEIVTIIGPNGAGESTPSSSSPACSSPRGGHRPARRADLAGRSPGPAFVPQERNVFERNVFASLTVAENLDMGCLFERHETKEGARPMNDWLDPLTGVAETLVRDARPEAAFAAVEAALQSLVGHRLFTVLLGRTDDAAGHPVPHPPTGGVMPR
ncbi:hypothetical protein [Methylobacterium frigidaeris]|uniref:ABC transporter domain-containing protein n=1 Tax=Methylobacterium frigidaeris TaxID=2038277 RepID=A0AA37HHV9_9HYPH|nr:hypothetical protein [Methylobacterium frigidaeris]GJD65869.1 hypothetical protein MPEAHAMD_6065 [Methylobacterium frigidaeris]